MLTKRRREVSVRAILAALAVVPVAANAQTRPEVTIPTPDPAKASTATVTSERVAPQNCPPEFETSPYRTTISSIVFARPGAAEGESGLPDAVSALLHDAVPAPNAEVPISTVCTLRNDALRALRSRGYVAAVQVPPQRLEGGVLKLNVILAKLVQVRVIGKVGRYDRLLDARIQKLTAMDPLNERDAERILLLANEVPGLRVRLDLRPAPGGGVGEIVGDLSVEYTPLELLANVQNYGSRELGRETGYISASIAGITGLADVTTLAVSSTADFKEQQVVQVGHEFGLGSTGFRIGAHGTFAWSRPDLGALDLRSDTIIASLDLSMPLLRSLTTTVTAEGGFEAIEQRTRVFGGATAVPLNRDRIRVLYGRIDATNQHYFTDAANQTVESYAVHGSVELRKGLDVLSASKLGVAMSGYSPSRPDGNPLATEVRAKIDGRVRLTPIFSLAGRMEAQWSSDALLNLEEYSVGSLTIGRGYDPGSNSGDRAVALHGEVRADLPIWKSQNPGVQVFGFYDNVWLWNLDRATTERDRLLRSVGGGMRLRISGLLGLEASYAHPIDPPLLLPNVTRPTDRVLLSLTMRLAPRL